MTKKTAASEKAVDGSVDRRRLRVASYNINGITTRLEILLRWLGEFQPDIVALQELKTLDERFPADALEQAGYASIWHGQKSWNGVAILSAGSPATPRTATAATSRRRSAAC